MRRVLLLTLLYVSACARKWEIPLEYSIAGSPKAPLGTIQLSPDIEGNYTGHFVPSPNAKASFLLRKLRENPSAYYHIYGPEVFSSNRACLLANSGLKHEFVVAIDKTEQKLQSIAFFPHSIYDAGDEECSLRDDINAVDKVTGTVHVTAGHELPSPEVVQYLQRMEEEKRARQHGAAQDNRSFLAKYWMYIVPAVIFLLISNIASPDQQE